MYLFSSALTVRNLLRRLLDMVEEDDGYALSDSRLALRAESAMQCLQQRLDELVRQVEESTVRRLDIEEANARLAASLAHSQSRCELMSACIDGYWEVRVTSEESLSLETRLFSSLSLQVLLGLDPASRLNGFFTCVHPDDREDLKRVIHENLKVVNDSLPAECRLRVAVSGYRWFQIRCSSVREEGGRVASLVCTLRDIQDCKCLTETLETSEQRFQLMRETIREALWEMKVVEGDPVNPHNKLWWSPQFIRLLGFEDGEDFPAELDSWASRLHPEDRRQVLQAFAEYVTRREATGPLDLKYRLRLRSGEYSWFRARGMAHRDEYGIPLRVWVVDGSNHGVRSSGWFRR